MRVSDMFPSKYLKADDLQNKAHNVSIDRVCQEEIKGDDGLESKWIVYFQGREKGLVLNQTNAFSIAQLHGDDVGNWGGKPIELYPATVTFQGRPVACIRVRMASGQTVASQQTYAQRREPPVNDPAMQGPAPGPDFNDEVPF